MGLRVIGFRVVVRSVRQRGAEIRILSGEVCIRGALVMGGSASGVAGFQSPRFEFMIFVCV